MTASTALVSTTQAKRAIAEAKSLNAVVEVRDKSEALRNYMRSAGESLEVQNAWAEVRLYAERRAGEMLSEMNVPPGRKKKSNHDDCISLADIGVSQNQSTRWQRIASIPEAEFDAYLSTTREAKRELTAAGLYKLAKVEKAKETVTHDASGNADCTDSLGSISGQKFGTIYADPPWRYGNQGTRASTDNHYLTMSVDEICAMPIAPLAADDAHLHLWTTNAFLFEAKRVIEAWGFEYKSCFVWVKTQMGIGNYWRVSHEFMLLGIRGRAPFRSRSEMSWKEISRTQHSAKPHEVREAIERVSPGPYLELFGRKPSQGWTVYGNQIEKPLFASA